MGAGLPTPTTPQPQGSPQTIHFQFDPDRLTDVDGDGWLEYEASPRYGSTNPMVYQLQGEEVVVAEYDTRRPERLPLQIYHGVDGSLEPVAP